MRQKSNKKKSKNVEFRDGRDKYPCCVTQQGDDTCTRMMIFPNFFTEMIEFFFLLCH